MTSTIFLDEHFLHGNGGDGIILDNSGVISTIQVGSNIQNPMLTLSNYDKASPNLLLNPEFDTGTTSDWVTSGSVVVQTGTFPGEIYETVVNNLSSISQQVDLVFENKHPIFEFWHRGEAIILSLETRDIGDSYVDGINRIIPESEDWINYSISMRNYFPETAISAKITLSSVWDNSIIAKCNMMASDYCSSVNIGDEFDANSTDVVRISGKKLMVGNGLPAINDSILDIRGNSYFLGDLTVTGTITSGPIFGSIGTQKWVSNIIFTSGSQTQINFTSGNIQLVSGQIFGVNAGDSGVLSQTTFLYLDSDVSTTTLQVTTDYSLCIGANKIFIGTCYPGTSGYASFVSQSNNLPLINGGDLITPFSITNGNLAINSVTASNITVSNLSSISANFGNITAGTITLSGTGSYLTMGAFAPPSSSGAPFTAGIYQDYTGIFLLNGTTLNTSMTQNGISAGGGTVVLNSSGQSVLIPAVYDSKNSIKFVDGSGNKEMEFYVTDSGTNSIGKLQMDNSTTGTSLNKRTILNLSAFSKSGYDSVTSISSASDGGTSVGIVLWSISGGQAYISNNDSGNDVDFKIKGDTNADLFYLDAGNDSIGMGTSTPNINAILDITSTTKAFMPPRMTTTQRDAISSPTAGMLIYNSTTNKLNIYTTTWEQVTSI